MRVLKPRRDLDLALEPLLSHPARHLLRQHFHHDLSAEMLLLGQEEAAHSSGSELTFESVGVAEGLVEGVAKISHLRVSPAFQKIAPESGLSQFLREVVGL